MKLNDMVESKYIKQSDVPTPKKVTVEHIKKVNMANEGEIPEYKWTVKFEEFPKPMAMNTTNLKRMFKYCGQDTDEWIGKRVIVYSDPDIEFKGEIVGGLRIRGPQAQVVEDDNVNRKLASAAGIDKDDIPF